MGGVHPGPDDDADPLDVESVDASGAIGAAGAIGADEFAARARIDGAVRDRHRRAATVDRALGDSTVLTALLGAADHPITLHLTAGHGPIAGTMFAVGADVVEVHAPATTWWLALDAIAAVETTRSPLGDPADQAVTTLIDLATDLVDTAEPVTAVLSDGTSVRGEVVAVGAALLLRQQHPDRTIVVSLDHLVGIGRPAGHAGR